MYISHAPGDRGAHAGVHGLSADAPDLRQFQKSLTAIRAALDLNPRMGYVKGSRPRQQLEEAFESVPPCSAPELGQQLKGGGTLAKLFRYRLATSTQQAMIDILIRKANECLVQNKEQERQLEVKQKRLVEEQKREKQRLLQLLCELSKAKDDLADELCRRTGEDDERCRKLRSDALKAREQDRKDGIRCP